MDHPVSHTAAVVAGVSLILLMIVMWTAAGVPRAARSPGWWAAGLLVGFVLATSLVTYFRPHAFVSPVPLAVAGAVLLALCAWHAWLLVRIGDRGRLYQPVVFFVVWLLWAGRKFLAWRAARSESDRDRCAE